MASHNGRIFRHSVSFPNNNNNNNNFNTTIMFVCCCPYEKIIARVHAVHLRNADWMLWLPTPNLGNEYTGEGCYLPHPPSPVIILITWFVSWYSFYRPRDGGRLSQPWHRNTGIQLVLYTYRISRPHSTSRTSCKLVGNLGWQLVGKLVASCDRVRN